MSFSAKYPRAPKKGEVEVRTLLDANDAERKLFLDAMTTEVRLQIAHNIIKLGLLNNDNAEVLLDLLKELSYDVRERFIKTLGVESKKILVSCINSHSVGGDSTVEQSLDFEPFATGEDSANIT